MKSYNFIITTKTGEHVKYAGVEANDSVEAQIKVMNLAYADDVEISHIERGKMVHPFINDLRREKAFGLDGEVWKNSTTGDIGHIVGVDLDYGHNGYMKLLDSGEIVEVDLDCLVKRMVNTC